MLIGTNQTHVQAYNQRIVLDIIRRHAPISRAEIAQMTNLTRQTVSNLVSDLISGGLIVEGRAQKRNTSGSRRIGLLLNPSGGYSVGIHLERTYLTGVLLDLSGAVRERVVEKVSFPEPDVALIEIETAARHLLHATGDDRQKVVGIGVSLPGPLFTDKQQLVYADNLPNWQGVPVQDALATRLKLPVIVENDATAAAVGERWYGAGKGYRNFFFIYLDVGLGGGIVINGQPYRGVQGNAGEFAYAGVKVDGEYIEQIGKQVSLARLDRELRDRGISLHNAAELEKFIEEENPVVMEWLERTPKVLSAALVNVINVLDPEIIFLGGGLPDSVLYRMAEDINRTIPPLMKYVKRYETKVVPSELGVDAAAFGVAALPIHSVFGPSHELLVQRGQSTTGLNLGSLTQGCVKLFEMD